MAVLIDTEGLSPMQRGRLDLALGKLSRYNGEVRTLRDHLRGLNGEKRETDAMCDWNRRRFNSMSGEAQRAYEARLRAKRYYLVDGWSVPKIVYDAVRKEEDA